MRDRAEPRLRPCFWYPPPMRDFETPDYEESPHLTWVTLNRSEVMNASDTVIQRQLRDLRTARRLRPCQREQASRVALR
jgi:hypothetical protein